MRVVAHLSVLTEYLPDDIGALPRAPPALRVSLDERVSPEIVRSVREGTAEIGVCWDAGDWRAWRRFRTAPTA